MCDCCCGSCCNDDRRLFEAEEHLQASSHDAPERSRSTFSRHVLFPFSVVLHLFGEKLLLIVGIRMTDEETLGAF